LNNKLTKTFDNTKKQYNMQNPKLADFVTKNCDINSNTQDNL